MESAWRVDVGSVGAADGDTVTVPTHGYR